MYPVKIDGLTALSQKFYSKRVAKFILGQLIKKKRISKRRFAALIGARYDNIFRIFRSDYDPKLSLLNRCAKALHCRVRDLLKE